MNLLPIEVRLKIKLLREKNDTRKDEEELAKINERISNLEKKWS
jgi:hypothetical protein